MTTRARLTPVQADSMMAAWDIAAHYGIGYSGDCDPIRHGGFFYSTSEWAEWGYASCVEFWHNPDAGTLNVQRGTIHRPDDNETMQHALSCVGIDPDDYTGDVNNPNRHRIRLAMEVEAVRSYMGAEWDGMSYPHLKTFNLDNWRKEAHIWKSILPWIEELAGNQG